MTDSYSSPRWISLWFAVSTILVCWDFSYCFMRPRSMEGGDLHWIWAPYKLYAEVDFNYGWPAFNAGDGFTNAQSLLNVFESLGNVLYLYLAHGSSTPHPSAPLVGFTSAMCTFAKTVLYWAVEYYCSYCNIKQNTPRDLIMLWVIPNGAWIVMPFFVSIALGSRLVAVLRRDHQAQLSRKRS